MWQCVSLFSSLILDPIHSHNSLLFTQGPQHKQPALPQQPSGPGRPGPLPYRHGRGQRADQQQVGGVWRVVPWLSGCLVPAEIPSLGARLCGHQCTRACNRQLSRYGEASCHVKEEFCCFFYSGVGDAGSRQDRQEAEFGWTKIIHSNFSSWVPVRSKLCWFFTSVVQQSLCFLPEGWNQGQLWIRVYVFSPTHTHTIQKTL